MYRAKPTQKALMLLLVFIDISIYTENFEISHIEAINLSNSVVKIISDDNQRGSGFFWPDNEHIITSLHIVAGSKNIKIYLYENNGKVIVRSGKIEKYSKKADIALLKLDRIIPNVNALKINTTNNNLKGKPYLIIGFPLNLQRPLSRETKSPSIAGTILGDILNSDLKIIFKTANMPSIDIDILALQSGLLPGDSGAPIFNSNNEVVAIGNGGYYYSGTSEINWAIPAKYLNQLTYVKDNSIYVFNEITNHWYGYKSEDIDSFLNKIDPYVITYDYVKERYPNWQYLKNIESMLSERGRINQEYTDYYYHLKYSLQGVSIGYLHYDFLRPHNTYINVKWFELVNKSIFSSIELNQSTGESGGFDIKLNLYLGIPIINWLDEDLIIKKSKYKIDIFKNNIINTKNVYYNFNWNTITRAIGGIRASTLLLSEVPYIDENSLKPIVYNISAFLLYDYLGYSIQIRSILNWGVQFDEKSISGTSSIRFECGFFYYDFLRLYFEQSLVLMSEGEFPLETLQAITIGLLLQGISTKINK